MQRSNGRSFKHSEYCCKSKHMTLVILQLQQSGKGGRQKLTFKTVTFELYCHHRKWQMALCKTHLRKLVELFVFLEYNAIQEHSAYCARGLKRQFADDELPLYNKFTSHVPNLSHRSSAISHYKIGRFNSDRVSINTTNGIQLQLFSMVMRGYENLLF